MQCTTHRWYLSPAGEIYRRDDQTSVGWLTSTTSSVHHSHVSGIAFDGVVASSQGERGDLLLCLSYLRKKGEGVGVGEGRG